MSVEAFTVDGKVTLDITPFQTAIDKLSKELTELKNGLNSLGINASNFTNELALANSEMVKIKEEVVSVDSDLMNAVNGMGRLREETAEFGSQLGVASETVSALTNETSTLSYNFSQFTTEVTEAVEKVQVLTNEFSSMRYYIDMAKAEAEGLLQIEERTYKARMDSLTALQSGESRRIQNLHNIIDYLHMEEQQMEANASIQKDIVLRLEREEQKRQEIMQNTLNMAKRELSYLEQQHQAEVKLYDDIIRRYEAQGKLATTVTEQLGLLAERNATEKEEIAFLEDQLIIQKSIVTLLEEGTSASVKYAETLMKRLDTDTEVYAIIEAQLVAEKERLAILEEQDAVLKKQTADREKQLATSRQGNQLDNMAYLPRRIMSMALTMWGFNEIMDIYETTSANLNARGSMQYFGNQLQTDNRYLTQTNQTLGQVRRNLDGFGTDLDRLQKKYQKIDMTVIGANAEETAYKYGVQSDKLGDLAEAYAIYGSEFVKQGRTQEDSVLAINDALDGEVRRLKEVNIKMEDLEEHGYDGTTSTLIDALNEIAKERGYDVTAQNITNLSDAITVLELKISQDLASAFEKIEPLLREVAKDFVTILETFEWAFGGINKLWNDFTLWADIEFGVRNMQKFGKSFLNFLGWFVTFAITLGIVYKVVKGIKSVLGGIGSVLGKSGDIAKTTGDVAKTTGTIGESGGFKDNFMKEWAKVGKDVGKMARIFVDVAVAMVGAFVLIEMGILMISGIGYTYESLKPQFESGIEFIKEFGLWFALLGGAMLVFSYAVSKIPESAITGITKGATKLAYGMAIAMGLVAEAIGLLIAPMLAIALLGGTANFLGNNLDKGIEVITWIGNALHQIDLPIAIFIGGFLAISLLLGLVEPLTLALAIGIVSSLALVTEVIGLLIFPLSAIALLGGTASMLGEENINKGAETISLIGRVLQVLSGAIVNLLIVDIGVFGVQLVDWANRFLSGGKDGLTVLTDEILPSLQDFVTKFNTLDFSTPIDSAKVQAVSQMAEQIPPLFQAISKINNALGTNDAVGNVFGAIGGAISGTLGMGLKGKLDQLYNDVKDVMDFANKLGNISTNATGNASGVTAIANAVAQLQAKLRLMVTTINTASTQVRASARNLGSALTQGFKDGSASFSSTVVSVLAKGISEIQARYNTFNNGGRTLGNKMVTGFQNHKPTLKSIVAKEMQYALQELDSKKDEFYNKGKMLGTQLTNGFQDGMEFHSPALISRTIAKEMEYSMLALDRGKQLMYQGGVALGQALTNGYQNYGNIRTDIGVLASKGISSEQLQANAKNVQGNSKGNKQVPQIFAPTVNIDMSNSTIIGVQDLDARIRQSVDKAMIEYNSPNGAIGY